MNVPKLKQGPDLCGTTSLRMVLAYYGKIVSDKEVLKAVGGLKSYGIRLVKLNEFAKKLGLKTECLSFNERMAGGKAKIKRPSTKDIQKFLKRGLPVILNVRAWVLYDWNPSSEGHYIVITGYKNGQFIYNDPGDGKQHKIETEHLQMAWFLNAIDSSAYLLAIWPK